MNNRQINTDEEALALAAVINPGGQRLKPDGTLNPGLDRHETNCALVAISTAAFLQDGTEVGAFCAPSALLINGNCFLVKFIVSHSTLGEDPEPRIQIVPSDDQLRFYDDEEFQKQFDPNSIVNQVKEIAARYPGHSFLIHGRGDSHHWFNMTPEGTVIDIQAGLAGDQLLAGQIVDISRNAFGEYGGMKRFTELEIYPVDKNIKGQDILKSAEGMHQFNSMVDLARHIGNKLDDQNFQELEAPDQPLSELIDEVVDPYVEKSIAMGVPETGELHNAKTDEWFNKFCDNWITSLNKAGLDGHEIVVNALVDAATERPDLLIEPYTNQTWLSEATFREPGSTSKSPSVLDTFSGRCPLIKEAQGLIRSNQDFFKASPELGR